MANDNVYVGDVGTEIIINMQTDLLSATNLSLNIKKPDGSTTSWVPTVYNTKYLRYIIQSGDLSIQGKYSVQPSLTIGSWSGLGETVYLWAKVSYE